VVPGVHRIPLPLPEDGLRAVNVYAIESGGRLVVVDSGWNVPEAEVLLGRALAGLGAELGDIERFLVTHVHRDHYTQAISVRRQVGTRVGLGRGERPSLELIRDPARVGSWPQLAQLEAAGAQPLVEELRRFGPRHDPDDAGIWELPDDWLGPGPVELPSGDTLEAVETPGHTQGHLVFHDLRRALLFAGDHVLPAITPSIGFEPAIAADPLGDFLRSLALVRSRPDALLLPAHGPVAPSVHARVDQLVAHHEVRLAQTEDAVRAGAATAYDVARRLVWTRRERSFAEMDLFNRMLAVGETWAHLQLLVAQGRIRYDDLDGVGCYQPVGFAEGEAGSATPGPTGACGHPGP
jgi:glyoxylase-like metal-dependent hydrolase (beta-lactamase superfamily II)